MKAPWLRPAAWLAASTPALTLVWQALTDRLSADPVADVLNRLGIIALVLLVASLACTPLRTVTGWAPVAPLRRTFGLFAFWYALAHFATYTIVDQGLVVPKIIEDIVKRPFILVGFLAFLGLIVLAVTSPLSMVKRIGAKRWRLLHRLAYVTGTLACLHYFLRVKKDISEPVAYSVVVAVFLLVRLAIALRRPKVPSASSGGVALPPPPAPM